MHLNTPAPRENIAVYRVNIFYPVLFASCVEKASVLRKKKEEGEFLKWEHTSGGPLDCVEEKVCVLCLLPKLPPYT